MSSSRFRSILDDDAVRLARAHDGDKLAGYCVAVRIDIPEHGRLDWVSQLVVHREYRKLRVATNLLYSIWQFSDCFAWGLATANPFAVRALETATRRPCRASLITARSALVLKYVRSHVGYLPPGLIIEDDQPQPRVDTQFFIDLTDVPDMRKRAARADRPWALGDLAPGQEWFACTFAEQDPRALDDQHLAELLTGADGIWIQAYEGMTLDHDHAWHRHADSEAATVLRLAGSAPPATVLDVGCGDGRHADALVNLGFTVTGVDISARLIRTARERGSGATFEVADARETLPAGPFDLAISLYDVIGSSAREDDDAVLLQQIHRALRPGSVLVCTVMNTSVTLGALAPDQQPRDNQEFIAALEALPPSSTMEQTGAVFDPKLLVYYRDVYYRKEQFQDADWRLPAELVVRDRRFTSSGLRQLLARTGFDVIDIRPVQTGSWERDPPLAESSPAAKELLAVARRR
ncbi:MAG: class I SAM-dependent methyltransferase [Polyangiaceae bacterium]|nr:class I SAM-dependent methyltransferase [Polyangiaceae bacterium]